MGTIQQLPLSSTALKRIWPEGCDTTPDLAFQLLRLGQRAVGITGGAFIDRPYGAAMIPYAAAAVPLRGVLHERCEPAAALVPAAPEARAATECA
ncbi:MAG: hypothetical protein MK097_02620 [Dechloromonas sp.]|nr:hypothetical protein [Dechloromonas sp.]